LLFYETVIKKEEPPFEFKILLFLDGKGQNRSDEKEYDEKKTSANYRDINL